MTQEELVENLGTIAHSGMVETQILYYRAHYSLILGLGTQEFLKQLEASSSPDKANVIGQFGVGFYSAFMVGKQVKVYSRSAKPGSKGYCWTSDGCVILSSFRSFLFSLAPLTHHISPLRSWAKFTALEFILLQKLMEFRVVLKL